MRAVDVLPRLLDPNPALLCENIYGDRSARYHVPVEHRAYGGFGPESDTALAEMLPDLPSVRQFRTVLRDTGGIGLFAPARRPLLNEIGALNQGGMGAVIVLPPEWWPEAMEEFRRWQFDGIEAAFAGLPYGPDDVLMFAKLNYSPDGWLLVLDGPMAGAVVWWTHDGGSCMDRPWAADVADWGRRVWAEVPAVFGGHARYGPWATTDAAPEDALLYPVELVAG